MEVVQVEELEDGQKEEKIKSDFIVVLSLLLPLSLYRITNAWIHLKDREMRSDVADPILF
jgi:hypothetical protein